MNVSPLWLLERLPVIVGFQTKFEHPVWLSLLLRDQAHNILVETLFYDFSMYIGGKAEFIFLLSHLLDKLILFLFFLCHFI